MKFPSFLFALLLVFLPLYASAIVDTNHNGVSDVWERTYNGYNLFPSFDSQADPDHDGWTNAQEAAAGTDPFDPTPPAGILLPQIAHIPATYTTVSGTRTLSTPEAITLSWPTLTGKQYTLLFSPDLTAGSWTPVGLPRIGDGLEMGSGIPITQPDGSTPLGMFWRVSINDIDSDGDGFTDAEEYLLGGDPHVADRDGDGLPDAWEIANGLDPDDDGSININNGPDGDPDGDGIANGREKNAGTKANDANDFPIEWVYVTNRVDGTTGYLAGRTPPHQGKFNFSTWDGSARGDEAIAEQLQPAIVQTALDTMTFPTTAQEAIAAAPARLARSSLQGDLAAQGTASFYLSSGTYILTSATYTRLRCWLHAPSKPEEQKFHFIKTFYHGWSGSGVPYGFEQNATEMITITIAPNQVYSGVVDLETTTQSAAGVTHISTVNLQRIDIVPDSNMVGVIGDVVKSAKADSSIKHFVTPKTNGPLVGPPLPIDQQHFVLKAVGVTAEQITSGHVNQIIEWEGGEAVPNEPLKRRVNRNATAKTEVKIKAKQGGGVVAEMHVWVVWTTITTTNGTPIFKEKPNPDGASKYEIIQEEDKVWRFKFKIEPSAICDPNLNEKPDFTGLKKQNVPGSGNIYTPDPSRGPADTAIRKWDVSRQMSVTLHNPNGIPKAQIQSLYNAVWANNQPVASDNPVVFPALGAEGNDDPTAADEDDNPYALKNGDIANGNSLDHAIGEITSIDAPRYGAFSSWGAAGRTFAVEVNFREFARLEIWDGNRATGTFWYRISDFSDWHHYFNTTFDSTQNFWKNTGSSSGNNHPRN